jgi:uncharacterized membrane protein
MPVAVLVCIPREKFMQSQSFENREIADSDRTGIKLGKGLGWFSIGLGLAELLAPRGLARFMGIPDDGKAPWILRAYGLRELAAGAVCLAKPGSPVGPQVRFAGDLLDLATLALGARHSYSTPRTVNAFAMVAGAAGLDAYAAVRQMRRKLGEPVRRAVTIALPAKQVYDYWRRLENLPSFMKWVQSVTNKGNGISHWVVKTPAGVSIEYDAEIIEDVPGRRIAWRTLPGATVPNEGTVTFLDAPGNRGTEVIVEMRVAAPLGKTIASEEANQDLHRFKQVMELGEVVLSDATLTPGKHPAQPPVHGGIR